MIVLAGRHFKNPVLQKTVEAGIFFSVGTYPALIGRHVLLICKNPVVLSIKQTFLNVLLVQLK